MASSVATLDKLKRLAKRRDLTENFVVHTDDNRVKMVSENDNFIFENNKKEYTIPPFAIDSLLRTMEMPTNMLAKLEDFPDLISHNVNYIMQNRPKSVRALVRGKSVVGFTDPASTVISNRAVLRAVEKTLGSDIFIDKYNFGQNGSLNLNVTHEPSVKDKKKYAINKDDYFNPGVHIFNSPLGNEQTEVEGYLLRLACTNGAIANDIAYKAPKQIGDDSNMWLRSNISEASELTHEVFKNIKRLQKKEINGDPIVFLSTLFESLRIPHKLQNKIMSKVAEESSDNMYDVFNVITHIASHDDEIRVAPRIRNQLMRVATHYVDHVQELCQTCSRPRSISMN